MLHADRIELQVGLQRMQLYDEQIKIELKERVEKLEAHFKADVAFYYGPMHPAMQKRFRDFIRS